LLWLQKLRDEGTIKILKFNDTLLKTFRAISKDVVAEIGGHPTSALSLAHLIATLMYHTMRWRPEQPRDPGADRLVLFEGHAVPIIYAACADLGATMPCSTLLRTLKRHGFQFSVNLDVG
jgi:transketolase